MTGSRGLNPPGLWNVGTGWPVTSGVGVGRGYRGVGRPAVGEAEACRVVTAVTAVDGW
jgi:hypothetical protein